jgi:hypothetical protein
VFNVTRPPLPPSPPLLTRGSRRVVRDSFETQNDQGRNNFIKGLTDAESQSIKESIEQIKRIKGKWGGGKESGKGGGRKCFLYSIVLYLRYLRAVHKVL